MKLSCNLETISMSIDRKMNYVKPSIESSAIWKMSLTQVTVWKKASCNQNTPKWSTLYKKNQEKQNYCFSTCAKWHRQVWKEIVYWWQWWFLGKACVWCGGRFDLYFPCFRSFLFFFCLFLSFSIPLSFFGNENLFVCFMGNLKRRKIIVLAFLGLF